MRHSYPVAPQASPAEVQFRWSGLSQWMERGLTFWWYDRNWKFSVPPLGMPPDGSQLPMIKGKPGVPTAAGMDCLYSMALDPGSCKSKGRWRGLSDTAWGR